MSHALAGICLEDFHLYMPRLSLVPSAQLWETTDAKLGGEYKDYDWHKLIDLAEVGRHLNHK